MLRSAEVMHLVARRAAEFGVAVEGPVRFELARAVARKDAIVGGILDSIHGGLDKQRDAIEFVRGDAAFLTPHEIDVEGRSYSFGKAIIATGARRHEPPIAGLERADVLNNRTALELERLPSHLVVIGGGYVGIEFAQMYARFGSTVTLLGRNAHLAPGEDPELSDLLAGYLREEGIDVHTGISVREIRTDGQGKVVVAENSATQSSGTERPRTERPRAGSVSGEQEIRCDDVLVATGRVGNTDALDLPAAGVAIGERGFIRVDEELRTNQPHIWAIGDVKGGWMFTHVATYDGRIAALNAVKGLGRKPDYRVVPRAVFSDPTLAAVGLSEAEAREKGYDVAVGSVPAMGARALAIGDTRGRLKAIVNRANGEILGYHILAPHADDLLHEAVAAMYDHGSIERIGKSIHVHPTLSEMVKSAARAAK